MRKLTTHNRHKLLKRTLASLNIAQRPKHWTIDLLIIANACTDGTHVFLESYKQRFGSDKDLPMQWAAEPVPGKSHALNRGISLMNSDAVVFVDDDHRVSTQYLLAVCRAFERHPEVDLFCGRILPGWDGTKYIRCSCPTSTWAMKKKKFHTLVWFPGAAIWHYGAKCLTQQMVSLLNWDRKATTYPAGRTVSSYSGPVMQGTDYGTYRK